MLRITKVKGLMLALVMAIVAPAVQAQTFEEGNVIISAGYGFGNLTKALFNAYDNNSGYKITSAGPFFGKFEYAISDKIGVGVNIANNNLTATWVDDNGSTHYNYKLALRNTSALARLNVHFGDSDKFDFYWGAGLGIRMGGWKYSDNDPDTSDNDLGLKTVVPFGFETTFGARYYFVPSFGIYAEAGIAKAPIQFGLSVKF